jgi:SagB-type dehydrogenase family enzyme
VGAISNTDDDNIRDTREGAMSMQTIRTSPATRIIPPSSLSDGHWNAESYIGPKRWRLTVPGVMLLLACLEGIDRDEAIRRVADRLAAGREKIARLLSQFEEARLIVPSSFIESDPKLAMFQKVMNSWKKANWEEAAEYHLSTFDYPFPDYSVDGREIDVARMKGYVADEADVDRYRRYPNALQVVAMPKPSAALCPGTLATALRTDVNGAVTREALTQALSTAFGEIGKIGGGRWPRDPLIRRTSPSGGGRHPNEAYVLVLDVPQLPTGWYHVDTQHAQLELLRERKPSEEELAKLFPVGYLRVPMDVRAIVLIACVFDRNMYRYREPRTFRTVHMDAGHLAGTLSMAGASLGLRTHTEYPDYDEGIEKELGLKGLEEGFMMTVSFGTHPKTQSAVTA